MPFSAPQVGLNAPALVLPTSLDRRAVIAGGSGALAATLLGAPLPALAKGVSEALTSSAQGDLFKGDIDTLPMDALLDSVDTNAPRRAGTDSSKADADDERKAAALRKAAASADVALSPAEKQKAKQAAFAAKQAAESAKGFSVSLPNPF